MKRSYCLVLIVSALIGSSIGCSKSEAAPPASHAERAPEARADVKLVARDEAGETWRAKTVVPRAGAWVTVDEEVTLDARGDLVHAFTRLVDERGVTESTWIERGNDTVTIEHGDTVTRFHPPMDRPWIYAAVRSTDGESFATPLCAWTTYRVARREPMVRLIAGPKSDVVPADQLVIDTENGTTLAIGDDGVDVDARFVQSLRLKNVTFRRDFGGSGTFSFHVLPCDGSATCASLVPREDRRGS